MGPSVTGSWLMRNESGLNCMVPSQPNPSSADLKPGYGISCTTRPFSTKESRSPRRNTPSVFGAS